MKAPKGADRVRVFLTEVCPNQTQQVAKNPTFPVCGPLVRHDQFTMVLAQGFHTALLDS